MSDSQTQEKTKPTALKVAKTVGVAFISATLLVESCIVTRKAVNYFNCMNRSMKCMESRMSSIENTLNKKVLPYVKSASANSDTAVKMLNEQKEALRVMIRYLRAIYKNARLTFEMNQKGEFNIVVRERKKVGSFLGIGGHWEEVPVHTEKVDLKFKSENDMKAFFDEIEKEPEEKPKAPKMKLEKSNKETIESDVIKAPSHQK
ncbi:MAG: hypothetical protein QW112_00125 [Candidatus Micrarchaeia archaeon]